jgi:hypothetical protein
LPRRVGRAPLPLLCGWSRYTPVIDGNRVGAERLGGSRQTRQSLQIGGSGELHCRTRRSRFCRGLRRARRTREDASSDRRPGRDGKQDTPNPIQPGSKPCRRAGPSTFGHTVSFKVCPPSSIAGRFHGITSEPSSHLRRHGNPCPCLPCVPCGRRRMTRARPSNRGGESVGGREETGARLPLNGTKRETAVTAKRRPKPPAPLAYRRRKREPCMSSAGSGRAGKREGLPNSDLGLTLYELRQDARNGEARSERREPTQSAKRASRPKFVRPAAALPSSCSCPPTA